MRSCIYLYFLFLIYMYILDGCVRYCRSTRTSRIGKSRKIQICLLEVSHCHHIKFQIDDVISVSREKNATKLTSGKCYCVTLQRKLLRDTEVVNLSLVP